MRNLAQYPITKEEVANCLLGLLEDCRKEIEEYDIIGSTMPLEIRYAIDFIHDNEKQFEEYLTKRQNESFGIWGAK